MRKRMQMEQYVPIVGTRVKPAHPQQVVSPVRKEFSPTTNAWAHVLKISLPEIKFVCLVKETVLIVFRKFIVLVVKALWSSWAEAVSQIVPLVPTHLEDNV